MAIAGVAPTASRHNVPLPPPLLLHPFPVGPAGNSITITQQACAELQQAPLKQEAQLTQGAVHREYRGGSAVLKLSRMAVPRVAAVGVGVCLHWLTLHKPDCCRAGCG